MRRMQTFMCPPAHGMCTLQSRVIIYNIVRAGRLCGGVGAGLRVITPVLMSYEENQVDTSNAHTHELEAPTVLILMNETPHGPQVLSFSQTIT